MSYWSITAVILSLVFLAYKYPLVMWNSLPRWPWAGSQSGEHPKPTNENPTGDTNGIDFQTDSPAASHDNIAVDVTPKAVASAIEEDVPSFSLTSPEEGEESRQIDRHAVEPENVKVPPLMAPPPLPTKSSNVLFPAPNSAQRAGGLTAARNSSSRLMAAPARGNPTQTTPSLHTTPALRVPSAGPLPNRGPPLNSQQRAGAGGLAPRGVASTPNARGRVILTPGHSPMDWAALIKSGNVSGVSTFQRVTPSQLRTMTGRKGKPAWSSWQGKVYNITPYLPFHPGGEPELMKAAGRDGTKLFMDVHPWVNWENMLGNCLVGVMVPEDYGQSELEDMD